MIDPFVLLAPVFLLAVVALLRFVACSFQPGQEAQPPTVSTVSPNNGPAAGGTPVMITGANFTSGATVTFGTAAATNVVVMSTTQITATTPAGSAGAVTVTVTVGGQSGSLANGFLYTAFSHIQGNSAVSGADGMSLSVTLASAPGQGNLVCVGVIGDSGATLNDVSVTDGNNNMYTLSPHSTYAGNGTYGSVTLAYLLSAPSNASATITANWSNSARADIFVEEFSYRGTANFDQDAAGNGTGTAVNTPSITPTQSGELLFSVVVVGQSVTAPPPGGTQGPWTGGGGAIDGNGNSDEYDLSASSATAVVYTQNNSDYWNAGVMAFYLE
jgi:hypothetical protein